MERNEIIDILVNREGYSRTNAIVASQEAKSLCKELAPLYEAWLKDSTQNDYISDELSLLKIMEDTKSTYLAALLNMDWIIKEPDVAIPVIKSLH